MLEEKDDASSTFRLRCQRFFPLYVGLETMLISWLLKAILRGLRDLADLPDFSNAIGSQGIVIYS